MDDQESCCCQPHAPHGSEVGVKSEDKIHGLSQPFTSWVMQETWLTFLRPLGSLLENVGAMNGSHTRNSVRITWGKRRKALPRVSAK